jgi:hypothetical protein
MVLLEENTVGKYSLKIDAFIRESSEVNWAGWMWEELGFVVFEEKGRQ